MARPRADGPAASGADSPPRLPLREWRPVLRRLLRHALSDRLMVQAAGVAFFAVLSVAPVLVTAVSVYGAVNTPEDALRQLSSVAGMLPEDLRSVVADQLVTVTTASGQVLTFRGITGLAAAL